MMTASLNDVWLRHILWQTSHHCDRREQYHFERSEKHHIAVGDASLFFPLQKDRESSFSVLLLFHILKDILRAIDDGISHACLEVRGARLVAALGAFGAKPILLTEVASQTRVAYRTQKSQFIRIALAYPQKSPQPQKSP